MAVHVHMSYIYTCTCGVHAQCNPCTQAINEKLLGIIYLHVGGSFVKTGTYVVDVMWSKVTHKNDISIQEETQQPWKSRKRASIFRTMDTIIL